MDPSKVNMAQMIRMAASLMQDNPGAFQEAVRSAERRAAERTNSEIAPADLSSKRDVIRHFREEREEVFKNLNSIVYIKNRSPMSDGIWKKPKVAHAVPFGDLPRIPIKSLVLNTTHRGRVLYGTVIVDPFVMASIQTALEDDAGDIVLVSLYNLIPEYAGQLKKKYQHADALMPPGTRLAIREPFFKECLDSTHQIRVDNPDDITFLGAEPTPSFAKAMAKAKRHRDLGHADVAVIALLSAIAAVEEFDVLHALLKNLAYCAVLADRLDTAVVAAIAAVTLKPSDAKAHFRLAAALTASGRNDLASHHTARCHHLQKRPNEVDVRDTDVAIDIFRLASFDFPPPQSMSNTSATAAELKATGVALFSDKNFGGAMKAFWSGVEAVRGGDDLVEVLLILAECCGDAGRSKMALSSAMTALLLLAHGASVRVECFVPCHTALINALCALGELEMAESALESAVEQLKTSSLDIGPLEQLHGRIQRSRCDTAAAPQKVLDGPKEAEVERARMQDCMSAEQLAAANKSIEMMMAIAGPRAVAEMAADRLTVDTRIPPFHREYEEERPWPVGVDIAKCKQKLLLAYETARSPDSHRLALTTKDDLSEIEQGKQWMAHRLRAGVESSAYLRAFFEAPYGTVLFQPRTAYANRILHSFSNSPSRSEILERGRVHVAVGFNDLSQLLVAVLSGPEGKTLRWVGYDASEYAVAKSLVITAMLRSNATKPEHILQVWFSSTWSRATLRAFRSAVDAVLAKDNLAERVRVLLCHWASARVGQGQARRLWLNQNTHSCSFIGALKRKKDRIAVAGYFLTGSLSSSPQDVGSTVMWATPPSNGEIAMKESVFHTVRLMDLVSVIRSSSTDVDFVEACVRLLSERIAALKSRIQRGEIEPEFVLQGVYPDATEVHQSIRALRPYTISWSNVADYVEPNRFFGIARACSMEEDTVHYMYSMNWACDVKGAFLVDCDAAVQRKNIIEASEKALVEVYSALRLDTFFLIPVGDNIMNVADYTLRMRMAKLWMEQFFARGALDANGRQVLRTDLEIYSLFSKANTALHMTFTFDSKISFRMK